MSTKKVIPFALSGMQTIEFAIIKELYTEDNPHVELGINAEFGIKSLEDCEMVCAPEVSFSQDGKPFIKIKVACFFSVKPEHWKEYIQEEEQAIIFPKGFADHLLMIATGALRGVLHAKTEGTVFNRFILPTINVTTLFDGDVEMKL